jgi:hypothetical protein
MWRRPIGIRESRSSSRHRWWTGYSEYASHPSAFQLQRIPDLRFSAMLGQEPQVELGLGERTSENLIREKFTRNEL